MRACARDPYLLAPFSLRRLSYHSLTCSLTCSLTLSLACSHAHFPGAVYEMLESFVHRHNHHFAPIDKMPYTQAHTQKNVGDRRSTYGGSFTLKRVGARSMSAQEHLHPPSMSINVTSASPEHEQRSGVRCAFCSPRPSVTIDAAQHKCCAVPCKAHNHDCVLLCPQITAFFSTTTTTFTISTATPLQSSTHRHHSLTNQPHATTNTTAAARWHSKTLPRNLLRSWASNKRQTLTQSQRIITVTRGSRQSRRRGKRWDPSAPTRTGTGTPQTRCVGSLLTIGVDHLALLQYPKLGSK